MRFFVSSFGATGHVFPTLALSRELQGRGHEIWFETQERWRPTVEKMGFRFVAAPEYIAFPHPWPGQGPNPTLPQVVRSLTGLLEEIDADAVVNDFFAVPAILAAETLGLRRATLVPHPYPASEPGSPHFMVGLMPPRTPIGSLGWRLSEPWFSRRARRARDDLNMARAELGLAPLNRLFGGMSDELTLVATFPALEYPRQWPPHVHVTGPMLFELPYPDVEVPPGEQPLVLIAGSTAQDQELRVVRAAVEALASAPVRVLATLNQRGREWPGTVPTNARVVDWLSYSQVLPLASVMVCNGGHGTVARGLSAGIPLVVHPDGWDMGENAIRVAWSGSGVSIPRPLFGPRALGLAVRRVLRQPQFANRAREIATWGRAHDGTTLGATLIERLAADQRSAGAR